MTHSRSTLFAMVAACLLGLLHATEHAAAQDTKWNTGSGAFHDPANWTAGVPDADTNAVFFGKTGLISFTNDAATNLLGVVSESNVTFGLGGNSYAVSDLSLLLNSALTLQNGTFSASSALIAGIDFGPSTLTVGNGAVFQVGAGGLIVGTTGEANLIIATGGIAQAQSMLVGTVSGGSGFVNVQSGGMLETGPAILGVAAGAQGKANVAGSWTNAATIIVGSAGTGELNIGHDGTNSTGTGGAVSTMSLTVGASSGGAGTINLGENATLETTLATLATAPGSTANVNIGAGGAWTNHGVITVGALAGTGGAAAINVDPGGLLHSQSLTVGHSTATGVTQMGTGAIVVGDTNMNLGLVPNLGAGGLFVTNNSLSIVNGGLVSATRAFIDSVEAQVTANATVNGEESLLDLAGGNLIVGGVRNGALAITGGGKVQSGNAVIGQGSAASGSVIVSGQNINNDASEWEITGSLVVGDAGVGSLTIADGGLVNTTLAADIGAGGGDGEVLVTGAGSRLDVGGDLRVGFNGGLGQAVDPANVNAILNVAGGGEAVVGGDLLVNRSGMLMGDGTVIGTVTVHGILRPSNSTGTLNITGTLNLADGSTFLVHYLAEEMPGQPGVLQASMVEVDGDAAVHAGTLVKLVRVGEGTIREGDQLVILHADNINIIAGDLEDITIQDATATFVAWELSREQVAGDRLVLTAQFLEEDLLALLATLGPNFQRVAAAAFEVPELHAAIFGLPEGELARAIQSLMPLQHGAAAMQHVRTAQVLNNSFLGQMAAHRTGLGAAANGAAPGMIAGSVTTPQQIARAVNALDKSGDRDLSFGALADEGRWGGFIQGIGVWERVDSSTDRTGHRARIVGGHGGVHNHLSPDFILGISFGYLNTDMDFRDKFGDGEIHTFRVGPYLSWTPGGGDFFIDASATYGYHHNEVNRRVLLPAPATARSRYDAHDLSALAMAGYDFGIFGRAVITPMLGAEYTHLRTDAHTERGPGASIRNDSHTTDSLRGRLGAKLAVAVEMGETTIIPEIYGGWAHEFLDTDIDIRSRFIAGGPSFTTRTAGVGRSALQVGAGFTAMAGTYITLYVRYEGEFQSDRRSHGVIGGLNINF